MGEYTVSFETMDRVAVVIIPKQPFVDWLNNIPDPEFKVSGNDYVLEEVREHSTVYLIPTFDEVPEMEQFVKQIKPAVFEEQLEAWYGDEKTWPSPRTAKLFDGWFETIIDCMVFDTLDGEPILKNEDRK